MKTKDLLSKDEVVNLFISACEGGSNYWCKELTPLGTKKDVYEAMLEGFTLIDETTGKKHIVTKRKIEQAIETLVKSYPKHYADAKDDYDAFTGDIFLQLCVFNDVLYG